MTEIAKGEQLWLDYNEKRRELCGKGPCMDNGCPLDPATCHEPTVENLEIIDNYLGSKAGKSPIVHPNHYNRAGAMECWDEMVLVFGIDAVKVFCAINTWKYRYRAGTKDGESRDKDIRKSDEYMRKLKELSSMSDEDQSTEPEPEQSRKMGFSL